jgi:hypothetical protein
LPGCSLRISRSGVEGLRGEPGVGKTALLEYAGQQAGDLRVLRAVGVESEVALPFAALHQLLYPVLDRLPALPAPQAAALAGAFGITPGRGDDSFLVAVAVLTLLGEVSAVHRVRPGVVHLDPAPPTSSFPSGHTGAAVALYGCIAVIVLRELKRRVAALVVVAVVSAIPSPSPCPGCKPGCTSRPTCWREQPRVAPG